MAMMTLSKSFEKIIKQSLKYKIVWLKEKNKFEINYKGKNYIISFIHIGTYSSNDETYTWKPEVFRNLPSLKEIIKTKTNWFTKLLIKNFDVITDYIFNKTVLIEEKYKNVIPYFSNYLSNLLI